MADEEDDDSFGEFTFASNQPTVNSSSQIPVNVGVDDWGDFNFTRNDTSDHNLKSPQPQPPPRIQPKWEKIKGALPLSLFGDEEDVEEEEGKDEKPVTPVAGDDLKLLSFPGNGGFVSNNDNEKRNAHLGINDLIANLYGQRQQEQTIKAVDSSNGLEWDFTATNSTVSKDPLSKTDSFCSFGSNTAAAAAGNHGSDDEGGWEFMDAYSESKLTQNEKENKELLEKTVSQLGLPDGAHGHIDLFSVPNNGVFVESSRVDSKSVTNDQNGFAADLNADSKSTTNEFDTNPLGGSFDIDDSFGEFETAFMEQPSKKKELVEGSNYALDSHTASDGPVDLFAFLNGRPGGSHKENNGFDFRQDSVVQNGVVSDLFSQTEWKDTKDAFDSQPPGSGRGANDENSVKFEIASSEAGSKPEGSEASSKNYKEPMPLSIFGIEEDYKADSLDLQHELFKSSTHGKHIRSQSSNLSINDILSELYSQAEPISSSYHESNPDEKANSLHSTGKEYNSHVVDDDNFDDGLWEFKDASSQPGVDSQKFSFEKKLNNCMDFYSSLKDELFVIARRHIHSLKKSQSNAILVGEEMKVAALDKEIQEAFEELHLKDIISTEHLCDHPERDISLNQYIETLHKPDFQVLESEYHISRRLSLAESDLRTAIDLINHFTTVLKILPLAPKSDPAYYVSVWFKVISVCSQELKHGTRIWKQSLKKNIHKEILSEQQGKQFITALGEIYRAVVILGAAVKIYKPWMLLSGANLEEIYVLLEECHSLWSTSGLEEVTPIESLLDSINHIRSLDDLAIANGVLSREESQCRLSLLSPGVVPEMKMVLWNGDKYFVTLANLWANLINPEPPKLSLHAG